MEWVSVEERLPGDGQLCLAWYESLDGHGGEHDIAVYSEDRGFPFFRNYRVTHWVALEPPRGKRWSGP